MHRSSSSSRGMPTIFEKRKKRRNDRSLLCFPLCCFLSFFFSVASREREREKKEKNLTFLKKNQWRRSFPKGRAATSTSLGPKEPHLACFPTTGKTGQTRRLRRRGEGSQHRDGATAGSSTETGVALGHHRRSCRRHRPFLLPRRCRRPPRTSRRTGAPSRSTRSSRRKSRSQRSRSRSAWARSTSRARSRRRRTPVAIMAGVRRLLRPRPRLPLPLLLLLTRNPSSPLRSTPSAGKPSPGSSSAPSRPSSRPRDLLAATFQSLRRWGRSCF